MVSSVNIKSHSKEHMERIHYYQPPVSPVKPREEKPNTSLKIGLISNERLYNGFRFEAEIFILTEDNWKDVLSYIDLDFVLVESCLKSITDDWKYAQIEDSELFLELNTLIEFSKEQGIPTVYWFTQDHMYHDNYKLFSSLFDSVFCADLEEIKLLKKENIYAEVLLPSVQPILNNPLREDEFYDELEIGVLFDGWSDLFRFKDKLNILNDIKKYGLKIIDSKKEIFKSKLNNLPEYKDEVLGCVTKADKDLMLKYTNIVVSFDASLVTKISKQWDALEIASSRTVQLHVGKLTDDDIRKNLVLEFETKEDLLASLSSLSEDELSAERIAHSSWRKVNENHTFNHRLISICKKLKIAFNNKINLKASLVSPTYRVDYITQVIETYKQQTYLNKELILVYNGFDEISEDILKIIDDDDSIRLTYLHPEAGVGNCLNLGNSIANGDYCFRIDDDDFYSPQYINDMMLYANIHKCDILGTLPRFFYFEENKKIFQRTRKINLLIDSSLKSILEEKNRISGNTMNGKRSFFLNNRYPEKSFGAADTGFLLNINCSVRKILIIDDLNVVVNRRADQTSHTWQLNSKKQFIETNLSYKSIYVK